MKSNYAACLKISLEHEGGWADHPKDPGGATMKGITLATFRKYKPGATKADLRNISDDMLQKIYRVGYWNTVRGDDLLTGIDLAVNDFAINSGPSRAAKYLQAVLGVKQDGVIGDQTLAAMPKIHPMYTVQKLCAKRLGFVKGLKTFTTFGKGWSRRIADIEAKGVKMAILAGGVSSEATSDRLADLSDLALGKAKTQDKAATTTAGGSVANAAAGFVTDGDINRIVFIVVGALAVLAVIAIISRSRINKDRADAYHEAAVHG